MRTNKKVTKRVQKDSTGIIPKRKQKGAFHKNLEIMTNNRIAKMQLLDSEKYVRFLQDPITGFYVVFNGHLKQSHYTRSYQQAERFFENLITKI